MAIPDPSPGLVVRYDYLWSREQAEGRTQGKDRPACLVAASSTTPRFVVLLPITHSRPIGDAVGVEIPAKVCQSIGLDEAPSWVVVSEHNVDEWPNAGLSRISGQTDGYAYGFIPPRLFAQIKVEFLRLAKDKEKLDCPSLNDSNAHRDRLRPREWRVECDQSTRQRHR